MPMNTCRLCRHAHLRDVLTISHVPKNIQRLFRETELDQDHPIDLTVRRCDRCGFVQFPQSLDEAYYDDYLMTMTHSRQMQDYQQRQAEDFVRRFNLIGKQVKEVGCGDGSYLDHLRSAGAVPSGIEPSRRFREIALERGYSVESGYVSAERLLEGGPYDGFVTRQVLEHVSEIHEFLSGIHLNLKDGAFGLVEVPSLEKAISDGRYYDFFPDHVNYFSLKTLSLALQMNGFEVMEMCHDMFGEYNVAIVRKLVYPQLDGIQRTVDTLGDELKKFIDHYHAIGKKVAIWGAGGKGLSVMAAAGIRQIDLLVDGDPHKQGLFTPVSHCKVQSPSMLIGGDMSAVIITAMAYRMEIERTLIEEYRFRGVVAVLGHHLEVIETRE